MKILVNKKGEIMERLLVVDRTINIYPHCVVCGKKASHNMGSHVYVCNKHSDEWLGYCNFTKVKGHGLRKEWDKQFLRFLQRKTTKK